MATRTQKFYRDKSIFEQLTGGAAVFGTLSGASASRAPELIIALPLGTLLWVIALLMLNNMAATRNATIAIWITVGLAVWMTVLIALQLAARIEALSSHLFHHRATLLVDQDGIRQSGRNKEQIDLKWQDIRLIQHRRSAHVVRGRDKSHPIEISTRLKGHEAVSAFVKFAFLFRQEAGSEWRGLLEEVRARLEGPGFHFRYDGDRTDAVHVNSFGVRYSSDDGIENEMAWDILRESVRDSHKNSLIFRHAGSRSSITIPRGTDSDDIIEQFIRWAIHCAPDFSCTAP